MRKPSSETLWSGPIHDPDGASDRELLLAELKRTLKERGIRYRDLAARLGISETTVKRKLSGRGIDLSTLEAICSVADLRLFELTEMAAQSRYGKRRTLTAEQEQALADDLHTAFIFLLLRYNWTVPDIQAEFSMEESEIILRLRKLERLGLIDLYAGNRAKLRTVRHPEWRPGGPMRRAIDYTLAPLFKGIDLHDARTAWELEIVKLSPGSIAQIRTLVSALSKRMRELAIEDQAFPTQQLEWFSLFCAAMPLDPRIFWDTDTKAQAG